MTEYTGTTSLYAKWLQNQAKAANLGTDTFKILLTTVDYDPNLLTDELLADVSNELSGNGYARQSLTSVTFTDDDGVSSFKFADVVFSSSGAGWSARRWVIYDDSVSSPLKPLIATGLINESDTDVNVPAGGTLTISPDTDGLYGLGV